jgi:hypothetical protein
MLRDKDGKPMADSRDDIHPRRKQKLRCKNFCTKYPRIEREYSGLSEDNVTEEVRAMLVAPENVPNARYMAAKDEPLSDLVHLHGVSLGETIYRLNPIVLFRMLQLMYGEPDILGSWFSVPENGGGEVKFIEGFQIHWGYTFRVAENVIGEIRSTVGNSLFLLRFWCPESVDQFEHEEQIREAMAECFSTLATDIECNLDLFQEREEIKNEKTTVHVVTENIFARHYHSAERLKKLGSAYLESPSAKKLADAPIHEIDLKELFTADFMFSSAAFHLVVSLEAFVNAIYHKLLKEEFRAYPFIRGTKELAAKRYSAIEVDWGRRLLMVHLYCHGFDAPALSVSSGLWHRFERLRDFRNNKVHGSTSEEHQGYMLLESGIVFFYNPQFHFRGRHKEKKIDRVRWSRIVGQFGGEVKVYSCA